jgi:fructokinase
MSYLVAGIGEALWDVFPNSRKMGGAPGNFAYHASSLGASGYLISRVGDDAGGHELISRLAQLGVRTDFVELDPVRPTGAALIEELSGNQHRFTIQMDVAWDRIAGSPGAEALAARADAICFGSLAQRSDISRSAIMRLVRAARAEALRIFDVNLRQQFYTREIIHESLLAASVLKVNDAELPVIAAMFGISGEPRDQMAGLANSFGLAAIACTRGEKGSLLLSKGKWAEHPGAPAQVVDTVGAGDAFTAAMALGLLAGWELDKVSARANQVASYVASCAGATPILPDSLRTLFSSDRT